MSQLGKGLGALLDNAAVCAVEQGDGGVAENSLPVDMLQASEVQPRRRFDDDSLKSLSLSIQSQGVLQPLLVRAVSGGKYEIIAGERRWRASKMAGLTEVPVIVREMDDCRALEIAIVENVQRSDLNPIDEAAGYLRLVNEFNYTHEEMARVTGKGRSHITNLLRLLSLPDKLKDCVSNGLLTMGHAKSLLTLAGEESVQLRLANRVIKNNLSVREVEDLIRKYLAPKKSKNKDPDLDLASKELAERIQISLGMKVAIVQKEGVGKITVRFSNQNEMTRVLKLLQNKK